MTEQTPPVEHLATLYEITRSLNSTLDLDEVLDYVMDRVIQVTGAERGFLMLVDDKTDALDFRVARGIHQQDLENPKFEVSRTIINDVVRSQQPVLTDNAQTKYAMQESVVMKALKSILCVPITSRDKLIGLVYVENRLQAGLFDEQHIKLVSAFASQAGFAIENARLYQIAIEQGRMQRELEMAHNIQRGLLPMEFPVLPGYEVAVYWDSAREVAGDFYDCFMLDGGQAMGVVIADVSDKGAPAALFMAVARSLIRGNARAAPSPEHTLQQTNDLIINDAASSGMFVTVYYSIFEPGGYAKCVNAGHNLPLLWRAADGSTEWLPRGGLPLGWFDELPLQTLEYKLEPGDVIVFYTDGLSEAENLEREAYGEDLLAKTVASFARHCSAQQIMNAIIDSVQAFVGEAPPFDDKTVVVVRYVGT